MKKIGLAIFITMLSGFWGCKNSRDEICSSKEYYRSLTIVLNESYYIIDLENKKMRINFNAFLENHRDSSSVDFKQFSDSLYSDFKRISRFIYDEYESADKNNHKDYILLQDSLYGYYNKTMARVDSLCKPSLRSFIESMHMDTIAKCKKIDQAYQELLISHAYLSALLVYSYAWRTSISLYTTLPSTTSKLHPFGL